MTLVLSTLTQHEVIQVSDRRFTYLAPDGSVRSRNDEKNKAVLFCGRLMFSFTGRGDLGKKRRTDLWLADAICDVIATTRSNDQGELLKGLAEKCTSLFFKAYKGQAHAFVCAGWAHFVDEPTDRQAEQDEFTPYMATISNFHGPAGTQLSAVSDKFSIWIRKLDRSEGGFTFAAPAHFDPPELNALCSQLASADRARSSLALAEIMGEAVRGVAERNPNVGKGLMVNVLPRAALGTVPGFMALAGPPMDDTQTFLYIPPSGEGVVQLGPVTTCGETVLADFRAEPLPEDFQRPEQPARLPDDPPGLIRRWYLAPIVGDGTEDDPYRIETLGHGGSGPIESKDDGHPVHEKTVVLVSAINHDALLQDSRIVPLVDLVDLDDDVGDLDDLQRSWLEEAARTMDVEFTGRAREVVRSIGRNFQRDFDEANFWVK